ncbi:MAG TPA: gas vesicle protein [Micromonosporaceae bacterium]|jgi:hypothetical protein|nr:gas vesicle protein [Micromonosporaceae bacterium]
MSVTDVPAPPATSPQGRQTQIALVDLLDRVLAGGVVVTGEIALSIADVDLVYISLRALITSVRSGEVRLLEEGTAEGASDW